MNQRLSSAQASAQAISYAPALSGKRRFAHGTVRAFIERRRVMRAQERARDAMLSLDNWLLADLGHRRVDFVADLS